MHIITLKTKPLTGHTTMPSPQQSCTRLWRTNFEAEDPKLFKPMQLTYKIKKPQAATPKQIAFLESLIRKKGASLQWDPETISRSEASRMIDGLLKG